MGAVSASKYTVQAGWDDVPHLDEKTKAELLEATPPFLRPARSKGIPSLGAGAIYPIDLDDVTCAPFLIPDFWKRGYALDVGWNRTAAIWGAQDPSDGTIYLTAEYYAGEQLPTVHASAIKTRGVWMKGAIDPAARGRAQRDGEQLFVDYQTSGLNLTPANNAVEAGLYKVWEMLATRRLRIFTTLLSTQAEYRLYHRDEKGKVVKKNDHLMDAKRYLINTWDEIAMVKPVGTGTAEATFAVADQKAGY